MMGTPQVLYYKNLSFTTRFCPALTWYRSLCEKIIRQRNLRKDQVCCVGDDVPDLPLFEHSGISFAVADASPVIKDLATYTTKQTGGHGAVREVCEVILESRGKWPFRQGKISALHPRS